MGVGRAGTGLARGGVLTKSRTPPRSGGETGTAAAASVAATRCQVAEAVAGGVLVAADGGELLDEDGGVEVDVVALCHLGKPGDQLVVGVYWGSPQLLYPLQRMNWNMGN